MIKILLERGYGSTMSIATDKVGHETWSYYRGFKKNRILPLNELTQKNWELRPVHIKLLYKKKTIIT